MRSIADAAMRQQVCERLAKLSPGAHPLWGRMSAPQMLCHLDDSFLVALGARPASSRVNLFSRTVMKYVALRVPMQWPKNVATMPEVEQGGGGTVPSEFEQDRTRLLQTIERFCSADLTLAQSPHPLFGRMSIEEWKRWGYLHCDHHLRQFGV